jgi:hypothetical protein
MKTQLRQQARLTVSKTFLFVGITLSTFLILGVTCRDTTVPIPAPALDKAPAITINNFVVGGSGVVERDKGNVSITTSVLVLVGTELMISGSANNPAGGVQRFSITVAQDGHTLYTVQGVNTPDASGKVPDVLRILGSDGAGNPGSAVPLKFIMSEKQATTTATAVNFNGMTTTITITYLPQRPPQITSFTAAPNNGYIPVGGSATLSWTIANCDPSCNVAIKAMDGLNYVDLLSDFPNRPANGSMTVSPTRSTMTRYTLSAQSDFGIAAPVSKVVQLYAVPGSTAGQVYFFKMENVQSTVRPCFTMAIYAPDETTGQQWAEALNGGYTPTTITYADYVAGCN